MKRKLWIGIAAIAAAALLSGCGGESSEKATMQGTEKVTEKAGEKSSEGSSQAEKGEAEKSVSKEGSVKTPSGKFTVGFDQEFPPMGFVDDKGGYQGYDLELAEEVAKRLGLEFVPQPINWDAKDMELSSGNIDCIWNGFSMQGREDKYSWVGPYMANEQVFVVKDNSGIEALADLSGKAVEVQKDSSGLDALKEEENKKLKESFSSLTEVADYNTALMDLQSGACDAVCMDSVVAGYQITNSEKKNPGSEEKMRILSDTLSAEEYGIGFRKGEDELAQSVKTVLLEMEKDGSTAEISRKWFGEDDVFTLK